MTKLIFGDNFKVTGIATDKIAARHPDIIGNKDREWSGIAGKLGAYSWGSHCYVEEGDAMRLCVAAMAKKHGMMILPLGERSQVCTWPQARVIVQKPEKAHFRYFNETHSNSNG